MALTIRKRRSPVIFAIFGGVFVAMTIGAAAYFFLRAHSPKLAKTAPRPATIRLAQFVQPTVVYGANNFFAGGQPTGANNAAYVTKLTDTIHVDITTTANVTNVPDAAYERSVRATATASEGATTDTTIATPGAENPSASQNDTSATIWQQTWPLKSPERLTPDAHGVINDAINIPFRDINNRVSDVKSGLGLSFNARLDVTYALRISSKSHPNLSSQSVATISAPLNTDTFAVATNYKKTETLQDGGTSRATNLNPRIALIFAGTAIIILATIGILWRQKSRGALMKNKHQRELARIYRYHDGIMIKTKDPIDPRGRRVVEVESFDDILNLQENLKTPILTHEYGADATRFTIINDDVIYTFLLGKTPDWPAEISTIAKSLDHQKRRK